MLFSCVEKVKTVTVMMDALSPEAPQSNLSCKEENHLGMCHFSF